MTSTSLTPSTIRVRDAKMLHNPVGKWYRCKKLAVYISI
jgi:hypothetical protein